MRNNARHLDRLQDALLFWGGVPMPHTRMHDIEINLDSAALPPRHAFNRCTIIVDEAVPEGEILALSPGAQVVKVKLDES